MGQAFANLASAASQLTADIHYKMFHKPLFLTCLLQANIKNLTQTNEHIAKKCFTLMQTDGPPLYEIYGIASTT